MPPTATATRSSRTAARKSRTSTATTSGTRTRAATRQPITPEDLLQFRIVADPQISPDGSRVIFVRQHVGEKNEYVKNLWIVGSDSGEPRQFTSGGRDTHPRWSPDGSHIAFIGARNKHKPQIYVISADGGEATALTKLPEGSIGSFRWSPDGASIAFSFREQDPDWTQNAEKKRKDNGLHDPPRVLEDWWYRLDGDGYFNAQRFHLYIVDVETGEHRDLYSKDTLGGCTFDFSPDSKQLVIATNRDKKAMIRPWKDELLRCDVRTGKVTAIPGLPRGAKTAVRWSPDGRLIAFAGREHDDSVYSVENLELYVCDPVKGKPRSLTGDTDYCLLAAPMTDTAEVSFEPKLHWTPDSKHVQFRLGWHGECDVAQVPAKGGAVNVLTPAGAVWDMGNLSADGRRIAMVHGDFTHLPSVYVGNVSNASIKPSQRADFNRGLLAERHVATMKEHWITAEDGHKVQAWIVTPPTHKKGAKKKYPAVLEVHGGPHAQYGIGFFHEFQVLAAQGYVVVFSNPRGSKGYGRDHCAAIRGAWGTVDWTDVKAAAEFMRTRSFVDPKRTAIMGGSYGGYMTNWAIGHTDQFRAAITDRCVSNLHSMFGSSDYTEAPDMYFPGNSWDRPEKLWDQSPLKYFGNVKTPTLIIHSEGDLRCNVEQAEQVFTALKLLDVPTRLVRYPRATSHGMSRCGPPDMRLHRLRQIIHWYEKYLR